MRRLALPFVLLAAGNAVAQSAVAQSPNGVRTLDPPGAIKAEDT